MFSKTLKMTDRDWNMSELWQIVCKNENWKLVHLFILFYELFINAHMYMSNFKFYRTYEQNS